MKHLPNHLYTSRILQYIFGLLFFIVFSYIFLQFRTPVLAFTNGENAVDLIGQYNGDLDAPNYLKSAVNNSPNKLGLDDPQGMAMDTSTHRLFVVDSGNNRVLVYNLDSNNLLVDKTPDNVLGQANFTSSTSANTQAGMNTPHFLAYDASSTRLFVSQGNNRVTVYDVASITDGENAVSVLGQTTFTGAGSGNTQAGMYQPYGLAYDSVNQRLFVAGYSNNRVTVYDVASITNGENAINVLGQATFTSTTANTTQAGMSGPIGLAYDSVNQRLFVSQITNNRITVYDVASITDGENAINVLGQINFTSSTAGNTQAGLNDPYGLVYNSVNNYLYVAGYTNNRVTIYDVASITNGENAINVLGQATFTATSAGNTQAGMGSPYGLLFDNGNNRLFVSQMSSERVGIFDVATITDGENATDLIGQYDDNGDPAYTKNDINNAPNKFGLYAPREMAMDTTNHRLFVADASNHRVLVYNLSTSNVLLDYSADNVLGQANFYSNTAANTQAGMNSPTGVLYDNANNRLFVSQVGSNRVTVYDVTSITDGESAVSILGQSLFTTGSAANTQTGMNDPYTMAYDSTNQRLFVAGYSNNRVTVYDVASITNGENAINVLGQTSFTSSTAITGAAGMSAPYGLAYDSANSRLFVSNAGYHRVTVYDVASITNGENAINVLGQVNFTSTTAATTQAGMYGPRGLAYDSTNSRLFVTQTTNNRITTYDVASITDGENAVNVLGQTTFTGTSAGNTQGGMNDPTGILFDASSTLSYVSQVTNHRISIFSEPSISISDETITETEANVTTTLTVTLSAVASQTVTLNYTTSAGTAVTSTDYTAATGTITFAIGQTTTTVSVRVLGDALDEDDEYFYINLSNASGARISDDQGLVTITDNDPTPTVTLSVNNPSLNTVSTTATFTATLSAVSGRAVTIDLDFSGTATLGTDYTRSGTTITINAGSTTGSIIVSSLSDTLDEEDETVIVDISAVNNATESGTQQQTTTLIDNDDPPTVTFAVSTSTISENSGSATYTATLSTASGKIVTIDLGFSGTAVSSTDYSFSSSSIIISAGMTTGTITVTSTDDATDESDETIIVDISSVTNGTESGTQQATTTIVDDDEASTNVTLSLSGSPLAENGGTATFTATLSTTTLSTVTINLSFSGTAVSSTDYSFSSSTISISPGMTTGTITVTGVNNSIDATNKTIIVDISSVTNGSESGTQQQTATITDDDTAGVTITQSSGSTAVTEGSTTDSYTIVLDSQPTSTVTVALSAGSHVTLSTSSIIFNTSTWNSAVTVTVTAVNNSIVEGSHTDTITHTATSSDTGYHGISISNVSVTITDNDTAGVTITTSTVAIAESGTTATYTIQLAAQPTSTVVISINPDSQSSVSTSSITFVSSTWNTPITVTVTAVNDSAVEGTHTSTITHSAAQSSGGAFNGVAVASAVFTITDNDTASVTITTSTIAITESGTTATYTIRLATQPTSTVTIALTPDSQSSVSTSSIAFTTSNWDTPVTVTVTAVNDSIAEGSHATTITHAASSADTNYNSISIASVDMTITDNDTAGVTVTESSGSTSISESGTTDSYTIVLNTQPTASVTIVITTTTQANVSTSSIIFTTSNWNTAVTVTVTAVDDATTESTHSATSTHAASSADANYNAIAINTVVATVTDNDTPGFTVSSISGNTTEAGVTSTFTVVLNTQPTNTVTIPVSSDDTTEGTVSTSSIIFTTINWSTPQTITMTGVDDSLDDGDIVYAAVLAAATSADGNYNTLNPSDVSVTNTDNDTAGVTITESGGTTAITEGSTTDSYTIVLNSEPTNTVTISIATTTQSNVSTSSIIFTTSNWNTAVTVTVTAVNDSASEGTHSATSTHTAASADGNYNAIAITSVVAAVTDNDTAGVTVSSISGNTTEAGVTSTFTVVLSTQPTGNVSIPVSSDDTTEGTVSTSSLLFTTLNWNTPQTVTVTGVDDSMDDGNIDYSVVLAAATSADGNYNALNPSDVSVTNTDNDTASVTITTSTINIAESGTTATFTIRLATLPTSTVTITITPDSQSTVSTSSIAFTTSNWNTPVTVIVTAVDDSVAEGSHTTTITRSVSSTDTTYNSMSVTSINMTVTDNDTAGVTVTQSGGTTAITEGSTTDSYTIVLTSQPTADVTIVITTTTGANVSTPSITFTNLNWNTGVTVTVTAVDNAIIDGTHFATSTHTATSADSNYNAISIATVVATVTDNDTAGVTVSAISGNTTEAGGTATFTVVLNTQPTATVTIAISSDDTTEGTVSSSSLAFTTANWNIPKTVTLTGVDDALTDGDITYHAVLGAATSADADYNSLNPTDVTVINTDNDIPGVTVTQSSGSTDISESGTSDSYTIVLNTQPTASVTIAITTTTEANVSTSSIIFTTSNWNTAVTVTVMAVDDETIEGTHTTSITHTAVSADGDYNSISIASITATITDNDVSTSTPSSSTPTRANSGSIIPPVLLPLTNQKSFSITSPNTPAQDRIESKTRFVALELNADARVSRMAISSNSAFDGVSQEPYQKNIIFNVCSGLAVCSNGLYTVYVKFYSNTGVVSDVIKQTIYVTEQTVGTAPKTLLYKAVNDSRVYRIADGKKYWVPDGATFVALGYRWDDIQVVPASTLDATPNGPPMTVPEEIKPPITTAGSTKITKNLQYGMVSLDVKNLQYILGSLGFFPKNVVMNGSFGPTTKRAVQAFQRSHGISPIGTVGPKTREVLGKILGW